MAGLELQHEQYTLTREQLAAVVKLTIDECRSSWHYDEGVDMPVLGIRIDRLLSTGSAERSSVT
jgi:hypothetical protein